MRLPCLEIEREHIRSLNLRARQSFLCAGILFIDIQTGLRYTYNLINRYLFLSFAGEKICLSR